MNDNKKTISATGKKVEGTTKIIVTEAFKGVKPLTEIVKTIISKQCIK